jgi:hypothetical protein
LNNTLIIGDSMLWLIASFEKDNNDDTQRYKNCWFNVECSRRR